ncbi:MAG: carboxypeptidase regulatory-like domain-containing protein [Anaerolineales bacterium]|nr:carboxypeptidase regulatory-like domain-containing protein [Anaerolineales bacterium]
MTHSQNIPSILLRLMILLSLALSITGAQPPEGVLQPNFTVSGVIRHSGSPLYGIEVTLVAGGAQSMTTGSDGVYSFSGVAAGNIQIFVRPPDAMRLAYRNYGAQLSGDLVMDFDLQAGYLLQGEYRLPNGLPYAQDFWLETRTSDFTPLANEWLGNGCTAGVFSLVLPSGRYRVKPNPYPNPYHPPHQIIDLSTADVTGLVITLLSERPPGLPTTPPDTSKITVGPADAEGMADMSGAAGAVEPFTDVIVVNLFAKRFNRTIADGAGGFYLPVYAPPGSTLMVKYDPDGWRTNTFEDKVLHSNSAVDYMEVNVLPGTMIDVGMPTAGQDNYQDFSAVGGFIEDPVASHHGKWAGWWLSGRAFVPSGPPPLKLNPGQRLGLTNLVLHVTSPALNCTSSPAITAAVHFHLRHTFAGDGSPEYTGMWFTSQLFTPTGLPIEHESGGQMISMATTINFTSFTCEGPHSAVRAATEGGFNVYDSLPEGIYRILGHVTSTGVPMADVGDAPFAIVWYHSSEFAHLPLLQVGNPSPPHIPWTLFGDVPLNGRRGLQALQDYGVYAMPNRVVTQPSTFVVPRLDARSGQPIIYSLLPGSHWLSATDRRFPTPPRVPLKLSTGVLQVTIEKPYGGGTVTLGPYRLQQTSQCTPATMDGANIAEGTGQIADLYHLHRRGGQFNYSFDRDGMHVISLDGEIEDIYGRVYAITGIYEVRVGRILDIDSAQLPTTPYLVGDCFAPGAHVFPPMPAEVTSMVMHLPYSDPVHAEQEIFFGEANRYGYYQPEPGQRYCFQEPGEFIVNIEASYWLPDGTLWVGSQTWGGVVEGSAAKIAAHGRRGMDYDENTIYDMPAWFEVFNLPPNKVGVENYYPYFIGDIHWGNEDTAPGDSIHTIITVEDLTPADEIYNLILANYPNSNNGFRWPPRDTSLVGLQKRLDVGEAPLFISTTNGKDPAVYPNDIEQFAYWYGSSERPDVHVRELISEDNMGTAYWRFNDTYNMQIGEGARGDLPGDLKWEFGGAVFRILGQHINEYAVYSSLWVLLPHDDPVGARVTPPFQYAAGGMNGGPIMTLNGQDIDMLFLPRSIRPGDILHLGDTVAFSGHVGPPLDSRVTVDIVSPSNVHHNGQWHANKIGWIYDPEFEFAAYEIGRWTVNVSVLHDRPYLPTGLTPLSHNTGTVLGTSGSYEFYVVEPGAQPLFFFTPRPGVIRWPTGLVELVAISGLAPQGATSVRYTIHDKGVVMGQGVLTPDANGVFTLVYDAKALNTIFPFVSLTAHEGNWEGLADEVKISFLALGPGLAHAGAVTLIGEEVFVTNGVNWAYAPVVKR